MNQHGNIWTVISVLYWRLGKSIFPVEFITANDPLSVYAGILYQFGQESIDF